MGSFLALELTITPSSIAIPYSHLREDEVSFVIEGEIGVRIGGQVVYLVAALAVNLNSDC